MRRADGNNLLFRLETLQHLGDLVQAIRHRQPDDRPAEDVAGGVAVDPLSSLVPAGDDAIEVLADDGIRRRFDDGGQV